MYRADRQTDKRADITKLTVAFRNLANAAKNSSTKSNYWYFSTTKTDSSTVNLLAPELFFFNFSTPVHKMWIIQEPNVRIMKQAPFWREKKRRVYTMFKIFSTYICYFHFYTVQENKIQSQTANYLYSCLLFLEIKF